MGPRINSNRGLRAERAGQLILELPRALDAAPERLAELRSTLLRDGEWRATHGLGLAGRSYDRRTRPRRREVAYAYVTEFR
jgi:hypothetical protein